MSFDGNTGPVNLGSAEEVKLSLLAEQVVALAGSSSQIMQAPRRLDDPMQRKPDTVLATAALGWRPQIKLAVGLELLIRSIRKIPTQ
jgi:nucleoside-diphosphate-sugar epimerase